MLPDYVFRRAAEATSTGLLITDSSLPDNQIVYCNSYFTNLTGYQLNEVIGRNCRFLQGPDSDQDTVAKIREAMKTHADFRGEILNYRKDGTTFWNQLTISPVKEADGTVRYFIGIQHDITAQKLAEFKRDSLIQDLKSINFGLSNFASMASHEIKNPLGAIHGFAQLISRNYGPLLDEKGRGFLDRIITNAVYMNKCVTDLLALASLSYAIPDIGTEDLNEVTEEAVRLVLNDNSAGQIVLANKLPTKVRCSKQLVLQVLSNLFSNAIKYGEGLEKGIVVENLSKPEEDYYVVGITDHGNGVADEVVDRLFEPFVTSGANEKTGTGLGLAIVKRIMEMHQGAVSCKTSRSGTTFLLKFPK